MEFREKPLVVFALASKTTLSGVDVFSGGVRTPCPGFGWEVENILTSHNYIENHRRERKPYRDKETRIQ
ncbi:hypothetical protein TNCV_4497021 [Trichonephila clavipes]|nr:hypothetical protein TNCV_4497021 [Trichonephila clavipes]